MNYSVELVLLYLSPLLLFYFIFTSRTKSKSKQREAPEPSGAWPIIGHLALLGRGDQLLHHTLGDMADKYGPAFNIRLGTRRAFVVSSWEVAKECFTVNDKAVSNRPYTAAVKHMGFNNTLLGFTPYNPLWREIRKIVIVELLSNRRIQMLKDLRSSEVNFGINQLFGRWKENSQRPVLVELNTWLEHRMINIIMMMVVGKRCFGIEGGGDEAEKFHKAIINFFRLSGVLVLSDVIPSLWWLDLQGYEKQMKKTAREFDSLLGEWLDEHRYKRKLDLERNKGNFMDVMLSLEDEGKLPNAEHDSDTIIKSTCLSLILGASDTTPTTLTWSISLLLNHPDVLKKLQHELDHHVGKDRQVDEFDIKNLVFLQAVIKESLRLYAPGPILLPREAMDDCTIAGYKVKARTMLIVNAWKLQRDPSIWGDPSKYQPERFMGLDDKHVDATGQQFFLIPFGSGRRSCPAATLALQMLHLTLARIVHSFDLVHPGHLPVNMTEGPGLTTPKKKPLEVLLTPRLQSRLYAC